MFCLEPSFCLFLLLSWNQKIFWFTESIFFKTKIEQVSFVCFVILLPVFENKLLSILRIFKLLCYCSTTTCNKLEKVCPSYIGRAKWKRIYGQMRTQKAEISQRIRRIIEYYRKYEWRANARMRLRMRGINLNLYICACSKTRLILFNITKICLYNFVPLKLHFYIIKLEFLSFLFLFKNIDCGYSLEPPRRGGSNEYPQITFWVKI